jgi:REP element-mobilizing transposase RayT
LSPLDGGGDRLDKAKFCVFQASYYFIWVIECRCKVLLGSVVVRLVEVLKTIAALCGFEVFIARVRDGDHVYVFVSALPS